MYLTHWPVRKLQICKSVFIEFAPSKLQKVNKHQEFDDNFDIRRKLEHFEYEMNWTLDKIIVEQLWNIAFLS